MRGEKFQHCGKQFGLQCLDGFLRNEKGKTDLESLNYLFEENCLFNIDFALSITFEADSE